MCLISAQSTLDIYNVRYDIKVPRIAAARGPAPMIDLHALRDVAPVDFDGQPVRVCALAKIG